ncbi:MAG TPA: class I SAM-dependent methyltransferase [Planctomycetota bacterium]|nr:class I SAM-dependent methyltransferase [Planctomycetota bacterium]
MQPLHTAGSVVKKAEAPDVLELYRWAVQDPITQARVLQLVYARCCPGRVPTLLREDFAGTAMDSVAWVALCEGRQALAVEIDEPTLEWARARARALLGARADRLAFVHGCVRQVGPPDVPAAQVVAALNFSIFAFVERPVLRAYFENARRALSEHGVFVANAFGGPERLRAHVRTTTVADRVGLPGEAPPAPFEYQWEQHAYDALTAQVDCRIHFARAGEPGAAVRDAFRYRYRLWTLPELVEIAREAGFREVQVWQHTYEPGAGVFLGPVDRVEAEDRWTAYLVALP